MIVDGHCHAWATWPYEAGLADATSRGSAETLLDTLAAAGVDHALVVAARVGGPDPRTANPENNAYVATAVADHPDRLSLAAEVDSFWSATYHRPGAVDRLEHVLRTYQPQAVTHYVDGPDDGWLTSNAGLAFFGDLNERHILLSLHAPPTWLPSIGTLASHLPELEILLHHLGHVDLRSPHDVETLVSLAVHPRIHVKVSGPGYLGGVGTEPLPFPSAQRLIRTLLGAFGPRRLIWGSDFPVSTRRDLTYAKTVAWVRDCPQFSSPAERDLVLGGNLARLLRLPQ